MSWREEIKVPGSATSRKFIWVSVIVIGAIWVLVGIPVILGNISGSLPPDVLNQYTLGSSEGFLPLQLIAYSFVHMSFGYMLGSFGYMLGNLLYLVVLARFATRCLSFEGFIRVYSLGILFGGLVYVGLTRLIGPDEVENYLGGGLVLTTMLGAFLALRPYEETRFFGDRVAEWARKRIGCLCVGMLLFNPLLLLIPMRLWVFVLIVVLVWSVPIGIFLLFLKTTEMLDHSKLLAFIISNISGFLAGVIYGAVERLVEKRALSLKESK